ncbi:MAG: flagellar motor protein [Acidobacteriaceae bacterium]|nr:flagellar motor protein [Acidobacteriaceae bacterium]
MPTRRFDPTFVVGLAIAALCILGGLILERGEVRDVTQVTAALIVFGGTIGAVVVSTPQAVLMSALRRAPSVLWNNAEDPAQLQEKLISWAITARRSGLQELDSVVEEIEDRFLKKAIMLLVDGFSADEIRLLLETDMDLSDRQADSDAKVFDAAGGYAPTIGIIGAVLGLIQVMKHLDNMSEVGRGIAVAFVATVYGVSAANLLFLPMGSKIRNQARAATRTQEMIIEAVTAIQEGKNPRVIRQLLDPFVGDAKAPKKVAEAAGNAPGYAETRKAS